MIILASITCTIAGLAFLYNNFLFYKQATKANAIFISFDTPDRCSGRGCYWTRKVTLSFYDKKNFLIRDSQELWTPTLITGIFTPGNSVKVLFKPKPYYHSILDTLVPNLGPVAYEVKIYSWHYWGYPLIIIFLGPLIYFIKRKLQLKNKLEGQQIL